MTIATDRVIFIWTWGEYAHAAVLVANTAIFDGAHRVPFLRVKLP